MYGSLDWGTVLVLAAVGATVLYDRLTDDGDESSEYPAADDREAYANDELSHDEYERRVAEAVDPEFQRIRAAVEPINDIGPKTSKQLAREFDDLDALRDADREALESVHGVGESTADAIRERLK